MFLSKTLFFLMVMTIDEGNFLPSPYFKNRIVPKLRQMGSRYLSFAYLLDFATFNSLAQAA